MPNQLNAYREAVTC